VCAALGAWEATDGVRVCPGCLAGTTPDPARRPWYRRSRILVGRLAGHPVHVEPLLVLLVFVLVLPEGGWGTFAATMLALLVHAFGHAVGARLAGLGKEPITLALAGACELPDAPHRRRRRGAAALVTLAGPLGNLLVAGASGTVARLAPAAALDAITNVNLIVGLGSLLPVPPLDGGRLVVEALARSHAASCRIHRACALIATLAWIGMIWLLRRDPPGRPWLPVSIAMLPLLIMYCLMRGSEAPGASRWDAARAARARKADST